MLSIIFVIISELFLLLIIIFSLIFFSFYESSSLNQVLFLKRLLLSYFSCFFHFCAPISVKVVLTLSLKVYFITNLLRFSWERLFMEACELLYFVGLVSVQFFDQRQINLTLHHTKS